jgi:hypothetical protein
MTIERDDVDNPEPRTYTVLGFYPATGQRFATAVQADNAEDAEASCLREYEELAVVGVIGGNHECADKFEQVRTSADLE